MSELLENFLRCGGIVCDCPLQRFFEERDLCALEGDGGALFGRSADQSLDDFLTERLDTLILPNGYGEIHDEGSGCG